MSQDKPDSSRRQFLAAGGGLMVGLAAWHETIRKQLSDPDCPLKPEVESVPPTLGLVACDIDVCPTKNQCNPKTDGCPDQIASLCTVQLTIKDGDCIGHICTAHTCHDMWCREHICTAGMFHCEPTAYTFQMPDLFVQRLMKDPPLQGLQYAKSLVKGRDA